MRFRGRRIANSRLRHGLPLAILLAALLPCSALAQTIDEYQVKAAILFNFAKFVEWPAQTFKNDRDAIRICVLGQNPFGPELNNAVGGKTVMGRSFLVAEVTEASQTEGCHILFVSSSERKHLRAIFAELRKKGVLTVGETAGFASQGGMVNFKLDEGRVRLEINVATAEQANLRISSQVLKLAQIVK